MVGTEEPRATSGGPMGMQSTPAGSGAPTEHLGELSRSASRGQFEYTPEVIDRWLRDWPLLESLAETPRSSRHYLTWEHRNRKGPCETDPKVEQRTNAYFGDELSYADIHADILRAWTHLKPAGDPKAKGPEGLDARIMTGSDRGTPCGRWSLHFTVVEWRMRFRPDPDSGAWRPPSFHEIEESLGIRHGTASAAYREAIEAMAWQLGWTGEPNGLPGEREQGS